MQETKNKGKTLKTDKNNSLISKGRVKVRVLLHQILYNEEESEIKILKILNAKIKKKNTPQTGILYSVKLYFRKQRKIMALLSTKLKEFIIVDVP